MIDELFRAEVHLAAAPHWPLLRVVKGNYEGFPASLLVFFRVFLPFPRMSP